MLIAKQTPYKHRGRPRILVAALLLLSLSSCALSSRPAVRQDRPDVSTDGGQPSGAASAPSKASRADAPRGLRDDAVLDDYRLYAAENNPGLRALFQEWRAQVERAPQVRSLPEPRFTYTEYLRSVETRTGPQERRFALSQSFPWFGKLGLRGSIEEKRAAAEWQRFLAAQLALDYELRATYADYYYLGRSVTITRENLELLERLERVAREKFAAGAENHSDIIRLQVEMGRLEDRLASLEDMRNPLQFRLNALLNRAPRTSIPWPTEIPKEKVDLAPEQISRLVEEHNPELISLRHQIESASLMRDLAFKEYFPDFSIGVQTIATGGAVMPNTRDSGEDPWMVSLSLELPLWFSKVRAGEREAEAHWLSVREKVVDVKNRLFADVELASYRLRDAGRRIELYQDTLIPKAEEALASTEASFQADNSDFLDLIDAERVLLEFQLSREKARADRLRAEAELDRHLGRYDVSPVQEGTKR